MKKADPKKPAFYSGTVVPISAVASPNIGRLEPTLMNSTAG
jgi:hypothetical protein